MNAANLPLTVAWFPCAIVEDGRPALGECETTTWANFGGVFWYRREGPKDGPCFVTSRCRLEPDGRHVRRLKRNVIARTAVAMDIESNKKSGEIPPELDDAVACIKAKSWAAVVYTSHNHKPEAPRYRITLPISEEIGPDLPAPEIMADQLGLRGVLDSSKVNAAALFYLPSAEPGCLDHHKSLVIDGMPIDAEWLRGHCWRASAERQAEAERLAAQAHAEAEARRQAKLAAGFDPDDSLIEKLRPHFDLEQVLLAHGYDRQRRAKFRHPNSTSGSFGADIKMLGGIERVFSHNAIDPLHADNLPSWCGTVTALDVIDVVTILDFGGDRTKALRELAERFGLTKPDEQKQLAALLFRLIRRQATQQEIEAQAFAEGARLGLSRGEVVQVTKWVAAQITREAA